MSRYSQRPENALKRAIEFIEVGKQTRALDTLYEVFRNKKWAYNWSESVLEPIMFKYLELCVELKKSHIAKEGLFQYRNMFQSVNVGSLENVIRGYLKLAEEKTESAREHSHQAVNDLDDDLDNIATPESILLSAVSGEGAQDRSDRTILTPWVKFLWESYCQCLELLRTNTLVEPLYHDIARMAYQFCFKYNRKTEFRKLCDKLRKHLEDIGKLPQQAINVNLNRPETQQYNLETRLIQLDHAIQMELWQEAYKATEDIHNLMTLSKKSSVPKMMSNYYQKLAMVFWKAGPNYYIFHAAALFKLFQLNKEMRKNISAEDLQKIATRVLLATLSIPLPSSHPEFDRFIETDKTPYEKALKLAVLLNLNQPPTRSSLLKDLGRYNVLNAASPLIQELNNLLEVQFNPLELCSKVDGIIKQLNDCDQYIAPLRDVTLVTLIRQLSQVYETISYPRLLELASFSNQFQIESLLVECVRRNDMQIRVDHGKQCVQFGADLSESQREDKLEGVVIQNMPSEQIRNQLINMHYVLTTSLQKINPTYNKDETERKHIMMVRRYHETKHLEHQRILARHKIIEERKEHLEKMNSEREKEEQKKLEELRSAALIAEQKRLELEKEEKEKRMQLEQTQRQKDITRQQKLKEISGTTVGQKILKNLDENEIKNLDPKKIDQLQMEELQKVKNEQQQKMKTQEKKLDYFERAKRLEEIELISQFAKNKQNHDKKFWQEQEVARIKAMEEDRKLALLHRDRLKRMEPDYKEFISILKKTTFRDKLARHEENLASMKKERLENRKKTRFENRKAEYDLLQKEKHDKEEAERARKLREEEEKQKEELLANIKKKREEEDRAAKLKLQREEAAMNKLKSATKEEPPASRPESNKWRREPEPVRKPASTAAPTDDDKKVSTETQSWRSKAPVSNVNTESAAPPTRSIRDEPLMERPKFTRRTDDGPSRDSRQPPPSREITRGGTNNIDGSSGPVRQIGGSSSGAYDERPSGPVRQIGGSSAGSFNDKPSGPVRQIGGSSASSFNDKPSGPVRQIVGSSSGTSGPVRQIGGNSNSTFDRSRNAPPQDFERRERRINADPDANKDRPVDRRSVNTNPIKFGRSVNTNSDTGSNSANREPTSGSWRKPQASTTSSTTNNNSSSGSWRNQN